MALMFMGFSIWNEILIIVGQVATLVMWVVWFVVGKYVYITNPDSFQLS